MQHIEIFPWSSNFETGLTEIDEQHKTLVELLNLLVSHIAYRTPAPELNAVFERLKDYAVVHFQTEERLWAQYFPDDAVNLDHKAVHSTFLNNVLALLGEDKPLECVLEDIARFLTHWLGFHILESDRYAAHVVTHMQAGYSLEQAKEMSNQEMLKIPKVLVETLIGMYDKLAFNTIELAREINRRIGVEAELERAREMAEGTVRDLTSLYKASAAINKAIARYDTEPELLQAVCKSAVEIGGFVLAWVGREDAVTKRVTPLYRHGWGTDYLDSIVISTDETLPSGLGPSGTAMREWRPVICTDFQHDPNTAFWRQRSNPYNWRSSATYPITATSNGKYGLALYSDKLDYFTDDVRYLCEDLSKDIAFALNQIEQQRQIKSMEARMAFMATHDPLTGLLNRVEFDSRLRLMVEKGGVVAVLFIDIDQFKIVNDTLGHSFGDSLLVVVASRLQESVKSVDLVSRQGGDEFLVAARVNTVEDAEKIANRILSTIGRDITIDSHKLNLSVSIGIDMFPNTSSVEDLLKNSDMAMYEAKENRNVYRVYSGKQDAAYRQRLRIESCLKTCVQNNELTILLQPQVALKTRDIVGAEALVRWNSPTLGSVPPNLFIEIAENSGMILPITDWIINRVFDSIVKAPIKTEVSINLSSKQFCIPGLAVYVMNLMDHNGIASESVKFEITETSMMTDKDRVQSELRTLREHGIRLSVDDFGTGYSSLSYLKELDVHELKIDKSFVDSILTPQSYAIIGAIIKMAKALNLSTLAEGVETEEQHALLVGLGCDKAQGYLYHKPMSVDDYVALTTL